jgi:hypothetical protein
MTDIKTTDIKTTDIKTTDIKTTDIKIIDNEQNKDEYDNNTDSDTELNKQNDDTDLDNKQDLLSQLDKKIIIKYHKEGRNSRTYVSGLDYYFNAVKQNEFIKTLKKKLGTSAIKIIIDNSTVHGFGGDHVNTLYDYFVKIIPKDKIKRQ